MSEGYTSGGPEGRGNEDAQNTLVHLRVHLYFSTTDDKTLIILGNRHWVLRVQETVLDSLTPSD